MNKPDQNLNFTDAALRQISGLIQQPEHNSSALRVYIVGGGCSGFQYGFNLEAFSPTEEDAVFEQMTSERPLKILVDSLSMQYLEGSTIDYVENLQGARFVVNNPNAETTCGCGSSFSLKEV